MLRFEKRIRPSMAVGDVKVQFPQTSLIFERFGFHSAFDDCSIDIVARSQGLALFKIIDTLNQIIIPPKGSPE